MYDFYCVLIGYVGTYFVICIYWVICFWCTVWKIICLCAQYAFPLYRLESVLFLCTIHISNVSPGKCNVSVHSTIFWYSVLKVFCFCAHYTFLIYHMECVLLCAQYIFLIYRLESVLFQCTVHIYNHQWCNISLSNLLSCTDAKVLCCLYWFFVISPWSKQFQSMSKHVNAVCFLMNVTGTKYSSYTRIWVRYDVIS